MPMIEGTDMFLVNFKVKPTNNFKIYIDADSGFSIDKSVSINRRLRAAIDEAGFFPEGDYSLEVSSPGIDEPLVMHRQYLKNIGREVLVTLNNEAKSEIEGKLTKVEDEHITVATTNKKKEVTEHQIAIADIASIVVQISFK